MEKEFVPYELALRIKALGFNEPCFSYYLNNKLNIFHSTSVKDRINSKTKDIFSSDVIVAPLYQQAFRWFREKHNLFGQVNIHTYFIYNISNGDFKMVKEYDKLFDTYEEAELACLEKLIEIVEQSKTE